MILTARNEHACVDGYALCAMKAIGLSAGIHKAKWYNLENKTYS